VLQGAGGDSQLNLKEALDIPVIRLSLTVITKISQSIGKKIILEEVKIVGVYQKANYKVCGEVCITAV